MRGRPTRVALFVVSQPANSTLNVLKTRFGDLGEPMLPATGFFIGIERPIDIR